MKKMWYDTITDNIIKYNNDNIYSMDLHHQLLYTARIVFNNYRTNLRESHD